MKDSSGDPVVDELCQKILAETGGNQAALRLTQRLIERSKVGQAKYGHTLERSDLTVSDWLRHAQEEAMDLANYLQVLIRHRPLPVLEKMQEDALVTATVLQCMIDYP